MTDASSVQPYILSMAKHLPPSSASLRLLDVNGTSGEVLSTVRGDLDIAAVPEDVEQWTLDSDSVDAVVALNVPLSSGLFSGAIRALRPGGRLIIVQTEREPSETFVETLESAGYTRILVEPALEPDAPGVLMRGEKPHETADTLERIQVAAGKDETLADFDAYTGRYVHLLVQQTPNRPVWALRPEDVVTWRAAALQTDDGPVLLAFSSLPRAVGFMQPAVLSGRVKDVNKVGKFRREVAQAWTVRALLNPDMDALEGRRVTYVPIDRMTAEAPDE
jgi:hypothetical protein